MNTPNNKRRKESQKKIERAFVELLQTRELEKISVSAICQAAQVNRSTFYANYLDVFDLAEAVQKRMELMVIELYPEEREGRYHSYNFLRLFQHIKENQFFYRCYFKLGVNQKLHYIWLDENLVSERFGYKHLDYHVEFFRNGLNAVIKKWLEGGCRESPEEIDEIIRSEYARKT